MVFRIRVNNICSMDLYKMIEELFEFICPAGIFVVRLNHHKSKILKFFGMG